jgi:hypothetical protein
MNTSTLNMASTARRQHSISPASVLRSSSLNLSRALRTALAGASLTLLACAAPAALLAQQAAPTAAVYTLQSSEQLDQMLAPIALYPDALVAQILGAATYAPQVAEADRFVKANASHMSQDKFAKLVDKQAWDPSVKALTAFPNVLDMMNKNIPWTTSLGNAYYNQPQDVMMTVQRLRQRAYAAGALRSTPQQTVVYQPGNIVIAPADPSVVYVPVYNPWIVYGAPLPVYPAFVYVGYPTVAVVAYPSPVVIIGFNTWSWGFVNWSATWGAHGVIVYNHNAYVSRSVTVINNNGGHINEVHHSVVYGPNGEASRTAVRSDGHTDVHTTGPNGNSMTRDTTHYAGGSSGNITGSNGGEATRTATHADGQTNVSTTGPDGKSTSREGTHSASGGSGTMTGPNGGEATRTATRSDGQTNVSITGENGKSYSRDTTHTPGGSSSQISGPNGQTANRNVYGRGTGHATSVTSSSRGTFARRR